MLEVKKFLVFGTYQEKPKHFSKTVYTHNADDAEATACKIFIEERRDDPKIILVEIQEVTK